MTRSSDSTSHRASRKGKADNAESGASESNGHTQNNNENEDEREQAVRHEERGISRSCRRSSGNHEHEAADNAPNFRRGAEEVAANEVLGAFYNMLLQGAPSQEGNGGNREEGSIQIDQRKASNVLEAAAGNLALAANLYWDDYFATQAANQFEEVGNDPAGENAGNPIIQANDDYSMEQKPAAGVHRSVRFEEYHDDPNEYYTSHKDMLVKSRLGRSKNHQEYQEFKKRYIERRLRRSLDSDFQAADDDDETKKKKRAAKRARKSNDSNVDEGCHARNEDDEVDGDDRKMPAIRRKGKQEGIDTDRVDRSPTRRRMNRSCSVRHQDILKGDEVYWDDGEAQDDSVENDHNQDQDDNDKNNERLHHHLGRRQRREEPRRISAQDGIETSISVSDDELARVACTKSSSRRKSFLDLKEDPSKSISNKKDSHAVNRSAVMKAVNAIHRKINPNSTNLSKPSTWFLSPEKRRTRQTEDNDDGDDESVSSDTEDYICDDDWLRDETNSNPMERLWGLYSNEGDSSLPEQPKGDQIRNNEESNGNVVVDEDAMNVSGEDEDGYDNNVPSFRSAPEAVEGPALTGIPHTWLNAGFQLSECGSGLVIKSPSVEDIEFFSWRQQQVNDRRNAIPPPYHCKSLTAITSIVTGLLYTGSSIQGNEVNFTSGKKPWSSLSAVERKREFESRLSDALSALIYIAAQASLRRKKKSYRRAVRILKPRSAKENYSTLLQEAIEERKATLAAIGKKNFENITNDGIGGKENDTHFGNDNISSTSAIVEDNMSKHDDQPTTVPTSEEKKELMRRRLGLIPTCIWEDRKTVVAPRAGDGPPVNSNIKVKTSWTNIRDIELYVKSNLRAFTERGGIALFLETLIRIHGNNVITRQMSRCSPITTLTSISENLEQKALHKGGILNPEIEEMEGRTCKTKMAAGFPSLISCTCEDRQRKKHEEKPLPLNVRTDPCKLLDTTPSGTECASIELLTLILTGRVSSDWKECSTNKLGIGLLTENIEEVSHGLARPERPVWLLNGETCYSVLVIDGYWSSAGTKVSSESKGANTTSHASYLKTVSRVDEPGVSLNLQHWNSWYGQRCKTEMRLVASKSSGDVPSKKLCSLFSEGDRIKKMKYLLVQRRGSENTINAISADEHNANVAKQKENKVLPSELECIEIQSDDQKLYPKNHKMWRFDLNNKNPNFDPAIDLKPPAQSWIPYFQLTSRQKRMVETKLGPKINIILRTRWPDAVIDNFKPKGGFPVV